MRFTLKSIVFILFLFPFFSNAQQLTIQYDHEHRTVNYILDGEQVDKAFAKKGDNIVIEILNYNNYLYDIEIEEVFLSKKTGNDDLISNITNLSAGDLIPLSNMPIKQFDEDQEQKLFPPVASGYNDVPEEEVELGFELLEAPKIISDEASLEIWKEYKQAEADFLKQQTELEQERLRINNEKRREEMISKLVYDVQIRLEMLEDLEIDINSRAEEVQSLEKLESLIESAGPRVKRLKYNAMVSTPMIKAQATEILGQALGIREQDNVAFSSIPYGRDQLTRSTVLLENHNQDMVEYQIIMDEASTIMLELKKLDPERSNVIVADAQLNMKIDSNDYLEYQAQNIENHMHEMIDFYEEKDPNIMDELWMNYQEISQNAFQKTHYSRADKDEISYTIKLVPKKNLDSMNIVPTIELDPIVVKVSGGFKINTSVGLNFGQFFDPAESYYLKDDVIVSQEGDVFIPLVTTNVHFYYQTKRSWVIGGSMGVGVPMGGSSGFESTSFFFGPSLFIGDENRLIINSGIMGGKVKRLGAGYAEGDTFLNDQALIPLQSNYDLGLFVGISYNLGR